MIVSLFPVAKESNRVMYGKAIWPLLLVYDDLVLRTAAWYGVRHTAACIPSTAHVSRSVFGSLSCWMLVLTRSGKRQRACLQAQAQT